MNKVLISIVIPTYNGTSTISKTVDLIVSQFKSLKDKHLFELCITDDDSIDDTKKYLLKISNKYSFINCFYNKKRLGMDGNFLKAGLNASGKYIWFFGQDDLPKNNAINKVINILKNNEFGQLYIDYEQFSEKKHRIVCNSMIKLQSIKPLKNKLNIFNSAKEYFLALNDVPSFLPATIMKREYLLDKRLKKFAGTHFVQYAAFMLNLNNAPTGVFKEVLIKGIIPVKGWQDNGSKLFEITLGYIHSQYLVNKIDSSCFSSEALSNKKIKFLKNWPKLLTLSTYLGLKIKSESFSIIRKIFNPVVSFGLVLSAKMFLLVASIFN